MNDATKRKLIAVQANPAAFRQDRLFSEYRMVVWDCADGNVVVVAPSKSEAVLIRWALGTASFDSNDPAEQSGLFPALRVAEQLRLAGFGTFRVVRASVLPNGTRNALIYPLLDARRVLASADKDQLTRVLAKQCFDAGTDGGIVQRLVSGSPAHNKALVARHQHLMFEHSVRRLILTDQHQRERDGLARLLADILNPAA